MLPEEATDVDDVTLVHRTAAGDRRAFTALVHRHEAAVGRFARTVVGDRGLVDDVVQETFLAAYGAAATFEGRGAVRTWLLGIAFRQGSKLVRRRAGEPAFHEPIDVLGEAAGWGARDDHPEAVLSRAEAQDCLAAAFARLTEDERAVLLLRDVEQVSGRDAAEILSIPLAAMKSRLHRARLRLLATLRRTPCADDLRWPTRGTVPHGS